MTTGKKRIFTGAATAIVTPFDKGKIDYTSFGELIDWQVAEGINAIVVCGTTGESSTLTEIEHRSLIEFAAGRIGGRIPLIAGTGSNDTSKMIEMSRDACKCGADALLLITPYYNKATPKGLEKSFLSVADSVDKPIILYNVPSRTAVDIPLSVYLKLAEHENIVATKEASGNISAITRLASEVCGNLDIYSGNDDQIVPIMSVGGIGVISVLSNVMPAAVSELCREYLFGDAKNAVQIQHCVMRLVSALFSEVNPIPVKTALSLMGKCREEFRLPMCEMDEVNKIRLIRLMQKHMLI